MLNLIRSIRVYEHTADSWVSAAVSVLLEVTHSDSNCIIGILVIYFNESFVKVFGLNQYFIKLLRRNVANVISLRFFHDSFNLFLAQLFSNQLCDPLYIESRYPSLFAFIKQCEYLLNVRPRVSILHFEVCHLQKLSKLDRSIILNSLLQHLVNRLILSSEPQ